MNHNVLSLDRRASRDLLRITEACSQYAMERCTQLQASQATGLGLAVRPLAEICARTEYPDLALSAARTLHHLLAARVAKDEFQALFQDSELTKRLVMRAVSDGAPLPALGALQETTLESGAGPGDSLRHSPEHSQLGSPFPTIHSGFAFEDSRGDSPSPEPPSARNVRGQTFVDLPPAGLSPAGRVLLLQLLVVLVPNEPDMLLTVSRAVASAPDAIRNAAWRSMFPK